jgi:hypothetical protein
VLGGSPEELAEWFESVEPIDTVRCTWCMPYQAGVPVYVVRELVGSREGVVGEPRALHVSATPRARSLDPDAAVERRQVLGAPRLLELRHDLVQARREARDL